MRVSQTKPSLRTTSESGDNLRENWLLGCRLKRYTVFWPTHQLRTGEAGGLIPTPRLPLRAHQ